jgi:hypothetical protein
MTETAVEKNIVVALAGAPNVGESTVFNADGTFAASGLIPKPVGRSSRAFLY